MAALWIALIVVAAIAVLALCLALVLARRLRSLSEQLGAILPATAGRLPMPGMPIPDFSAVSRDGVPVSNTDLAGEDRLIAMLSSDCAACHDQIPVLRQIDEGIRRPIVLVIGPPERRAAMVSALGDTAVVIEEADDGPIATAFDIDDFPAVMLVRDGIIHAAGRGVAGVRASANT